MKYSRLNNPIPCISNEVNINNLIPNWWLGSLIYISYNIVLGFVVIASIGDNGNIMSPISGIVGGISLGLIAYIMVKGMLLLPNNLALGEMPMLNLTMAVNQTIGKLYSFGLWIALFTTALANGHSLSKRLREYTKVSYSKIIIFVLLSTIVFIPWKFSVLVGFIYPILGYLGIPLIIGIILSCPRLINNENYKN